MPADCRRGGADGDAAAAARPKDVALLVCAFPELGAEGEADGAACDADDAAGDEPGALVVASAASSAVAPPRWEPPAFAAGRAIEGYDQRGGVVMVEDAAVRSVNVVAHDGYISE